MKMIAGVILLVAAAVLTACGSYGSLVRNPETTDAFEANQVASNYTYYYFGRENSPYAVIGIDPAYTLNSKLWRKVDPGSERFKAMIYWIWSDYGYYPYGAYVLGPGGERIGVWYSSISWATVKVNTEDKTVTVIPDQPFLRDGPADTEETVWAPGRLMI